MEGNIDAKKQQRLFGSRALPHALSASVLSSPEPGIRASEVGCSCSAEEVKGCFKEVYCVNEQIPGRGGDNVSLDSASFLALSSCLHKVPFIPGREPEPFVHYR